MQFTVYSARWLTFFSLEQNTGQIAANVPVLLSLYRALQKKLPPLSKFRSYLISPLRHFHDGPCTKKSGLSRVQEEVDIPLGAFPVLKMVDVIVVEESPVNEEIHSPSKKWNIDHTADARELV